MRYCDLHLPVLVIWPDGKGIDECPLCAEQRKSSAIASELKKFIENERGIKDKKVAEWIASMIPGGRG